MLTSTSATTITSVTTTLAIGVTTASAVLSILLVGLLVGKEVSVTHADIDCRVKDSLNAAIVPLAFGFVVLLMVGSIS